MSHPGKLTGGVQGQSSLPPAPGPSPTCPFPPPNPPPLSPAPHQTGPPPLYTPV